MSGSQSMTLDGGAAAASPQPGAGAGVDVGVLQQLLAMQQQQMQQQQQIIASLAQGQQQLHAQWQQQQQQQQPAAHRLVATIGDLEPFTGAGSSSAAQQWLRKVEYRFAAAEALLGIDGAQGTAARLMTAARALTDDADRWFAALPSPPRTWDEFRVAFNRRFVSVATTDAKLSELQRLVATAQRVREKLSVEGLRRYAAQFMQLAGEIPAEVMSEYLKRKAFADGLPQRHAEYVLSKNRSDNPPALHALVDDVLARALDRAMSSASATVGGAGASGDAMQLDAISLCAAQFGVSREEASRYVEPGEGWAHHDTAGAGFPATTPSPPAAAAAAAAASPPPAGQWRDLGSTDGPQMERLLAAFEARFGKAAPGPGRQQSQRRNVPGDVRSDVPEALATARKEAGLCVKCGVVKYEPGGRGHNSRTCKAPVDRTTSAAEGRKRANF